MNPTAQQLRNRAWGARAIAARLDSAPVLSLERFCGTDTWQCPAADEFFLTILMYQQRLLGAVEDLRWQALVLERRAEDLEAADAAAAALASAG